MEIPTEFRSQCPYCGEPIDIRISNAMAVHGYLNPESGKYECNTTHAPDPPKKELVN